MALDYTKKTIGHFLKPHNIGEMKNPDGYSRIGNAVCGDQLDFFLKVEKGIIKDVKFLSFGCASNIATASVMTEKIKGMTLAEAKKYPWQKIVSELGGLPKQKLHCSVMAVQGLKKAIEDYEKRHGLATNKKSQSGRLSKRKNKASQVKKLVKKKTTKKKLISRKSSKKIGSRSRAK
ncbi:MAG: iron-sulfur cluster assembly scaffold protein [Patescibacteria group bacterium]